MLILLLFMHHIALCTSCIAPSYVRLIYTRIRYIALSRSPSQKFKRSKVRASTVVHKRQVMMILT
jgi:hypothetical protein